MIGTLSMYALVALGYAHVPMWAAVLPFALLNAFIGLPKPVVSDDDITPASTCAGLARALPMQMVYTSIGYLLGLAASFYL